MAAPYQIDLWIAEICPYVYVLIVLWNILFFCSLQKLKEIFHRYPIFLLCPVMRTSRLQVASLLTKQ